MRYPSTTYIYKYLLIFFAFASSVAVAQKAHIVYGEDSTENVGKYDRIYQMVSEQKVDINTLIKFDAVQWGQVQPSFTVEQRIITDFTIEPSLTASSLKWSREEGLDFAITPSVSFKYYYNRARREGLGKNVLGFSADYFLLGFSYTFTDDKVFYSYALGDNFIVLPNGVNDLNDSYFHYNSWFLMYGIQRKIGNMAYADIAGGVERNYFGDFGDSKVIPVIKIKLGFALSTDQFQRLTR